jgi:hypothetical protein
VSHLLSQKPPPPQCLHRILHILRIPLILLVVPFRRLRAARQRLALRPADRFLHLPLLLHLALCLLRRLRRLLDAAAASAVSTFVLSSAVALQLAALGLAALATEVSPRKPGTAADAAAATDEPVRFGAEAEGRAGMS